MQELLGMGSGDFEGVEFTASSESDGEEEPVAGGAATAVPRSNTTNGNDAEISNVENTPSAAAAAGPSPAAMGTTTIVQVGLCSL